MGQQHRKRLKRQRRKNWVARKKKAQAEVTAKTA